MGVCILEREVNVSGTLNPEIGHFPRDPDLADFFFEQTFDLRRQFAHGEDTARGFGRIVFVGSVLGALGVDPLLYKTADAPEGVSAVHYHAAKGAIAATARALACALAPSGVTVNVVSPGMIDTEGVAALLPNEIRLRIEARTPSGRLGTPEEVAAATVFLVSPQASFITGHDLVVDGGWSAW